MMRITLDTIQNQQLLRLQQTLRTRKGADRLLVSNQQVVLEITP